MAISLERQSFAITPLQGSFYVPRMKPDGTWVMDGGNPVGAVTNGNGAICYFAGYNGALLIQINEQAGGTAAIDLQGSMSAFADTSNGTDAVSLGYTTLSAGTRATAITQITVTANLRATFLVVDPYPWIRAKLSGVASGAKVSVVAYALAA